jgi:glutamine cyclotransferase
VTIRDKITVCDWRYLKRQDPVRLRKWLYVAITRATSLDDVQIFAGGNAEFNDQLWKLYLKKKVVRYKEQDKRANREMDPENYITEQWLDDNLCNVCIHCNCTFDVSFKECKVFCNLTGGP